MVSVSMAIFMESYPYYCQGAVAYCSCLWSVGAFVAWENHPVSLRQCCSCRNIRSGSSKDRVAMHLMRCLFFFTAIHQLFIVPQHVPGKENTAADRLSRDALSSFLQLVPTANPRPTDLPGSLMQALVFQTPDWTTPTWRAAFRSILPTDLPPHLRRHISQERIAT